MRGAVVVWAVLAAVSAAAAFPPVEDVSACRPDFVVFRPRPLDDPTRADGTRTGDGCNEHFTVVRNPRTGTFHAFWTQSTMEGWADQHIAHAVSSDRGRTWSEPRFFQGSHSLANPGPMASWQLPMVSRSGRIYVVWNQQVTTTGGQGVGAMFGTYSDDDGKVWSRPQRVDFPVCDWCCWQRPLRLGPDGRFLVADTRNVKTRFLRFENIDDDPAIQDIRVRVFADGEDRLDGEEAAIVRLPDGRLFAVMRTNFGHPTWSVSRDCGETWSKARPLVDASGAEIRHPRAPAPLYDFLGPETGSGRYFALFTGVCEPRRGDNEYGQRGPLHLYRGTYDPDGEQPVRFTKGEKLIGRPAGFRIMGNSCYSSYTFEDGEGVLWFPDAKFNLLGKTMWPDRRHPAPADYTCDFDGEEVSLTFDGRGCLASMREKATGRELVGTKMPFVEVRTTDRVLEPVSLKVDGDRLRFAFERGGCTLRFRKFHRGWTIETEAFDVPGAEKFVFARIAPSCNALKGGMSNAVVDDRSGVVIRGYTPEIEMRDLDSRDHPEKDQESRITCVYVDREFGFTGKRAGLCAGPYGKLRAMLKTMADEGDVTRTDCGGPWSLDAEANRSSYLFATWMDRDSVDDWIRLAEKSGCSTLHFHAWWTTRGYYAVDPACFPGGMDDILEACRKARAHGLRVGTHSLSAAVQFGDPYISPEWFDQFQTDAEYTLARPYRRGDSELWIREPPSAKQAKVLTGRTGGNILRLGDDLLQYSGFTTEPPYRFTGVGMAYAPYGEEEVYDNTQAMETKTAVDGGTRKGKQRELSRDAYPEGTAVGYLHHRSSEFSPKPGSPLIREVAKNLADFFNRCEMDEFYFDGAEVWNTRYAIDWARDYLFRQLHAPVGGIVNGASVRQPYHWWFRSLAGSWDHPNFGAKRFIDKHIETYRTTQKADFLRTDYGWWNIHSANAVSRGYFPDEAEYFGCKCAAEDSTVSVQGALPTDGPMPFSSDMQLTISGWWERLRYARAFKPGLQARMRPLGDAYQYRLRQGEDGSWRVTPYESRKHAVPTEDFAAWSERFDAARPAEVRIESLYAADRSQPGKAVRILDASMLSALETESAAGVVVKTEIGRDGKVGETIRLTARNESASERASWCRIGRDVPLASAMRPEGAASVWVRGDGSGAVVNFQLRAAWEYGGGVSENIVRLDFTGWRRVDFVLREKNIDDSYPYDWPYELRYWMPTPAQRFCYSVAGMPVNRMSVFLNGVKPGGSATVEFGAWEALPMKRTNLEAGAVVTMNGTQLAVPFTLPSGDYAELADGKWTHYAESGEPLESVSTEDRAVTRAGGNEFVFAGRSGDGFPRVEITVFPFGEGESATGTLTAEARARMGVEYELPRIYAPAKGLPGEIPVRVRPGERARLGFEILGPAENPTVDGRVMPVRLASAAERILCEDGQTWKAVRIEPGETGSDNRLKMSRRVNISEGWFECPFAPLEGGTGIHVFKSDIPGARITFSKRYGRQVAAGKPVCARRVFRPERLTRGDTGVRRGQPIDEASWIWAKDSEDGGRVDAERYLRFRNEFVSTGGVARIDVSADERFVLSVDGVVVARGPNRGDVNNWMYETYDIELPAGSHMIDAVVWRIGELSPLAQRSWRGGFILKADGAFDGLLTTGKSNWKVGDLVGTKGADDLPRAGMWGGGGTFRVTGTGVLDEEPSSWSPVVVVREPLPPDERTEYGYGARNPGWMLYPSSLPDQIEAARTPGSLKTGALTGRIDANSKAEILWDLEDYYCAYPRLVIRGGKGARIRWSWAEGLREDDAQRLKVRNRAEWKGLVFDGVTDEFVSDGRRQAEFTTPWWRAGRWVRISAETAGEPLEIVWAGILETRYPLSDESVFESDDPTLPSIRRICTRGLQMCAHEMFFDCPFYEQQMYPGDTRLQMLVMSALTGDDRLIRRGVDIFDWARRSDGLVPMNYPTRILQESATYSMCEVMMYADYVKYHGNRDWLKARIPGMRHTLNGLALHEDPDTALLRRLPGWSFMDWVPGWHKGVSPDGHAEPAGSINNLYWVMTLRNAASVERALGNDDWAAIWEARAERTVKSIERLFWDEGRGLYADTIRHDSYSEHAQCLALIADVPKGRKAQRVFEAMLSAGDLARCTVYFSHYLFEAYFKFGRGDLFLKRLDLWRDYVARDLKTPLEAPDSGKNGQPESRSDCHAWGSHPLFWMQRGLAGIDSAAPFFEKVRVAPNPGSLRHIRAKAPHPRGKLEVKLDFSSGGARGLVRLPEGVDGEFVWKGTVVPLRPGLNEI